MGEAYILGVDIGGTKIRMGLVNRSCTLHHLEVFSSQKVFAEGEPLAQLLCRILTYCQKYLGSGLPAAVAMGFPSSLDRTQRKVLNTPNIKPLQNIAVSDYLEPKLGIPVYLSKDVNLLLLHDMSGSWVCLNRKILLGSTWERAWAMPFLFTAIC